MPTGTDGVADSHTCSDTLLGSGSGAKLCSDVSSDMDFVAGLGSVSEVGSGYLSVKSVVGGWQLLMAPTFNVKGTTFLVATSLMRKQICMTIATWDYKK